MSHTAMMMPRIQSSVVQNRRTFSGRLGRIGRWIFERLSRPVVDRSVEVSEVRVNEDHLIHQIKAQKHAIRAIYHREIDRIVCGFRQLDIVMDEQCRRNDPFTFNIQVPTALNDDIRILGVKVQCIPWFDGILLVPKER